MIALTFSKSGREDIVLTEDDLFDFSYEENAYSGEAFELGGVCARSIYMIIDNNTQRFSRGTFANTRVKLEIDGNFYGYYNAELPKRRNGVIELTAYDDMVKLDVEFPTDYSFPQTFWAVYAQCVFEAGLAADISFGNVILNGVWDNGIISADYTDYIYANSCRNLVSGMAEWNGGFARINDDGRLQVDKFGTDIVREYNSGELMELDYSDDTVVFSKVKTSQKNKTYEKGDDSGYTLTLKNQYISYGLDAASFETYLTQIYDYYNGFSLTPMSFTLAEPDFGIHVGDRVQVYDEEERVTICGNISNIEISGNCSMKVICGGFENVASSNNFTPTSFSQINQAKTEAGMNSVTAEKLQSKNAAGWVTTDDYGAVIGTTKGGMKIHSQSTAAVLDLPESPNFMKAPVKLTNYNNGLTIDGTEIFMRSGNTLLRVKGDFEISDTQILLVSSNGNLIIGRTANGFFINGNNNIFEAKSDGLYFNGRKVLLESS